MSKRTGDPIPQFIIPQLERREEVNDKNGQNSRKAYRLNANSAWVKLRSSVNSIDLSDLSESDSVDEASLKIEKALELKGSSKIAETFVLIGGTQSTNSDPRSGVNKRPNVNDDKFAYNNFSDEYGLGYRPMPGIVNLDVQSKGTYGTLLEATVDFKVYSLQDLEVCEKIYFRPGYTALLEWGHSVYLSNDNNIVQAGPDSTISDEFFFSPKHFNEIDAEIQLLRLTSEGNYDGLIGFITNFSFNLDTDGSYNCTVKILSRGVVLEGLKPSITSDHSQKEDEEEAEEDSRKFRSIYHYIFDAIASKNPEGPNLSLKELLEKAKEKELAAKLPQDYDIQIFAYETDITGHYLGEEVDEIPLMYLTIGDFLRLLNAFNSLGSPSTTKVVNEVIDYITDPENNTKPDTSTKAYVPFDTTPGNKFATFPDHVSCDPIVALPPALPTGDSGEVAGQKGAVGWWEGFVTWIGSDYYIKSAGEVFKACTLDKLHPAMQSYATATGVDEVLNIFISTFAIEKVLDNILTGTQDENVGIYQVVKNILDLVSSALGGVNELDLYYNHTSARYQVVDRGFKPPGELPVINMSGLRTTVMDLSIDSTISRATSTQVAIAAQGNQGNYKENLDVLLEWNRGAIDRHMDVKAIGDSETDEDLAKKKSKYLKKLIKFWDKWNDRGAFTDQDYETEKIEALRSEIASDMQKLKRHFNLKNGNRPTGVVPVELSFKLSGIHGFIIGTSFKINRGLLPSKYDNWAFIVTGINHSITNNKWTTDIKTQFFPDRTSTGTTQKKIKDEGANIQRSEPTVGTNQVEEIPNDPNEIPNATRLRQVMSELGYSEKGSELANGGDITSKAADMGAAVFRTIKAEVPAIELVVTGGNDKYHQTLDYNSRHKKGTGLDFVISPATPQYIKKVYSILQGYAAGNNPNFRFINEYANPTKAATGRHFHISWGNGTEGNAELKKALAIRSNKGIRQYYV